MKADPKSDFVRRWIPELDSTAYPKPIVDHQAARLEAIAMFKAIKG